MHGSSLLLILHAGYYRQMLCLITQLTLISLIFFFCIKLVGVQGFMFQYKLEHAYQGFMRNTRSNIEWDYSILLSVFK